MTKQIIKILPLDVQVGPFWIFFHLSICLISPLTETCHFSMVDHRMRLSSPLAYIVPSVALTFSVWESSTTVSRWLNIARRCLLAFQSFNSHVLTCALELGWWFRLTSNFWYPSVNKGAWSFLIIVQLVFLHISSFIMVKLGGEHPRFLFY